MSITRNSLKRPAALFAAAAVLVGAAVPALLAVTNVSAAQLSSRSVQLSDSSASSNGTITSGVGSGTGVTYKITFTPTATNIGGIVVDICANTPLIGDTSCTLPAGFSWGAATPAASLTGAAGTWTAGSKQGAGAGAATPQVLTMANATPVTPGGAVTITVTGVTNPNATNYVANHYTFYARILTFDSNTNMTNNYTATGTTRAQLPPSGLAGVVDYGGAAMSLQNPIMITARVMETMSLCTSGAVMTAACAGASTPTISIGSDVNGTIVLGTALSSTPAYSQVSTNATNGYGIYMKARFACGGLSKDNGTSCQIPAVNSGGATAAAIANGSGLFGAQVSSGTAASGGSGTNTAVTRWAQTGSNYIMDTTSANDGVDDTYGSLVASSASEAPVTNKQADSVNNTYTFGAAASSTTPAGIYSQAFLLVAVGVF
jgi:hypothetical protein